MSKPRFISSDAIILRRQDYGEADKIIQAITPTGRLGLLAKGVKKEKSKLASGIQLLATNNITYIDARSDLKTLTSSRVVIFYENIMKDYERTQAAYDMIKIVYKNSNHFEGAEWFDLLQEALSGLNDMEVAVAVIETWFYLKYSEITGYGLGLEYDIAGERIVEGQRYIYDVGEKGLAPAKNGNITARHIKFFKVLLNYPLSTAKRIGGVGAVLADCLAVAKSHAAP